MIEEDYSPYLRFFTHTLWPLSCVWVPDNGIVVGMSEDTSSHNISVDPVAVRAGPVSLSYATTAPAWWSRHRRWVLLVVFVAIAGVLAKRWGLPVVRQVRLHAAQSRALSYRPDSEHVVFRQVELTGQHGQLPAAGGSRPFRYEYDSPVPWFEFARQAALPYGPIVFLGMRSAGQGQRVVYVRGVGSYGSSLSGAPGTMRFCLMASVLRPGGWTEPPTLLGGVKAARGVVILLPSAGPLRIRAGRADPFDPAHFTIECAAGTDGGSATGAHETLDCVLLSDDTVRITPRIGTAKIGAAD